MRLTVEGLLLLTELTKSNEELKKLVAFADGFQALFNIMSSEGMNNGGVVVQDCLQIVNNLLRGNSLTQVRPIPIIISIHCPLTLFTDRNNLKKWVAFLICLRCWL